jgi:hypothetical protein
MSELGQHYANGDSLKILETRRKIQDEIAQDKSVKLELYLQTFDANILLQHGNLAEAEQEFSTSEIAILMGKSIKNIESIRTSIRKKFAIDSSQDLNTFIQKLDL